MNRGVLVVVWVMTFAGRAQEFQPIDLGGFIDRPLSSYKPHESWAAPPRGLQTLEGVLFEIVGQIEVTGVGAARDGRFYRSRVTGIPVGRKAAKLHVLHGAGYADRDGTPVAAVVMHYADGERYAMPLAYGVHTRNWYVERNEQKAAVSDTNTVVAWRGSCPDTDRMGVTLRLFRTAFANPWPEKEIKTIDLVSLFSRATPVIVALSTESGAASPSAPVKFDDSPYRRELSVRLDPPAAAVVHVTAADAGGTYKFGSYTNDPGQPLVIDYPPQLSRLQLTVNTSEYLPTSTNLQKEFPKEITVKLNRGNPIGGFVRTRSGRPIKDAEVIVSQVTEDEPGQFVETDTAWVKTDTEGRWSIASIVGTNFSKMNFAVRHPEFVAADFQQFNDPAGKLSTEALLAGKAVLELVKGASISGTVVDAETRKPVPSFRMIPGKLSFFRDGPLRWDRDNSFAGWDGKFTFQFSEEDLIGDFALAIEAPGYLPAASLRYTNAGNYTHHFSLKKGKGIRGIAEGPNGKPIAGLQVYLIDASERLLMITEGGEIDEPTSRNVSSAVSDAQGRFVFEPRLDPNTIIAAHGEGYAEASAEQVVRTGKLALEPWGAVKGVLRVGGKVDTDHLAALYTVDQYGAGSRVWPPLHLTLLARPDESGRFVFAKVPPGERRIHLQYGDHPGPPRHTHGVVIDVKPGQTTEVTIGGKGHRVTGKVSAKVPVDWTRDMHWLVRRHPSAGSFGAHRTFWESETGRALQREGYRYLAVFRPDGSFHMDDVPPGEYRLMIRATDPKDENFLTARPVGELKTNVTVRTGPIDLGTLELKGR